MLTNTQIQSIATSEDMTSIVRLIDSFEYRSHIIMISEFLSMDLYQVLQTRHFKGLPIWLVKALLMQVLKDLVVLKKCGIIHGDIKPENIMLADGFSSTIKLIDFGSAKFDDSCNDFYFQSRYYRAPEVVLHLPYDYRVDVWSAACVAIEMFISYPIFAGQNEMHLLQIIEQFMGAFPRSMIDESSVQEEFFCDNYSLKTLEGYCAEKEIPVPEFHPYLLHDNIEDMIMKYDLGLNKTGANLEKELNSRAQFVDLVKLMLTLDPSQRPDAELCLTHPFFTSK